tara:strand:+ start:383 stop:676 length:294 start_codon:yes stop_codon:yes gene_type:complete
MKNFIRNKIRGFLNESELNSKSKEWNICDDFSISSYEELIDLLDKTKIEEKDKANVYEMLKELEDGLDQSSNVKDQYNTIAHKIATRLCKPGYDSGK